METSLPTPPSFSAGHRFSGEESRQCLEKVHDLLYDEFECYARLLWWRWCHQLYQVAAALEGKSSKRLSDELKADLMGVLTFELCIENRSHAPGASQLPDNLNIWIEVGGHPGQRAVIDAAHLLLIEQLQSQIIQLQHMAKTELKLIWDCLMDVTCIGVEYTPQTAAIIAAPAENIHPAASQAMVLPPSVESAADDASGKENSAGQFDLGLPVALSGHWKAQAPELIQFQRDLLRLHQILFLATPEPEGYVAYFVNTRYDGQGLIDSIDKLVFTPFDGQRLGEETGSQPEIRQALERLQQQQGAVAILLETKFGFVSFRPPIGSPINDADCESSGTIPSQDALKHDTIAHVDRLGYAIEMPTQNSTGAIVLERRLLRRAYVRYFRAATP